MVQIPILSFSPLSTLSYVSATGSSSKKSSPGDRARRRSGERRRPADGGLAASRPPLVEGEAAMCVVWEGVERGAPPPPCVWGARLDWD